MFQPRNSAFLTKQQIFSRVFFVCVISNLMQKEVIITGSLAIDYIMGFSGDLIECASIDKEQKKYQCSISPETKGMQFGGTAGNIGYSVGLLNIPARIVTTVGFDFEPAGYKKHLEQFPNLKLDLDILLNMFTATCYIVNDKNSNQNIVFHGGALFQSGKIVLKDRGISKDNVKIAIVSPDSLDALEKFPKQYIEMGIPFIYDPGQLCPILDSKVLADIVPHAKIIIGNEFEIEKICEKMNTSIEGLLKLCPTVIRTEGANGVSIFCRDQQPEHLDAVVPDKVVDTTGAGDGFRAGLLYGLYNDKSVLESAKWGASVSSFVVEENGGQGHKFNMEQLKQRLEKTYGPL